MKSSSVSWKAKWKAYIFNNNAPPSKKRWTTSCWSWKCSLIYTILTWQAVCKEICISLYFRRTYLV